MFIEQAKVEDAEEILKLQKLAYQSEAEIYSDYSIAPLTQSIREIEAEFEKQIFLKASADDGKIVGSIRAYERQGTCFIGRLIVHPAFQNQGIGTSLMHEIERRFEQARRFELFTGQRSAKNLHLYRKEGYKIFKSQRLTEDVTLVFMEKYRGNA